MLARSHLPFPRPTAVTDISSRSNWRWWKPQPSAPYEKLGCQLGIIGGTIGLFIGVWIENATRARIAAENPTEFSDGLPGFWCIGIFVGLFFGALAGAIAGFIKEKRDRPKFR
jgi:uncharacterized membrane protein YeaQ/YmgE (transglycosylase-associated protein family)